ncbi:Fpg/Nei family DNA glycosylase [Micrococcoides hystricis]|uniref:DNA-(apurinic or apyrimidinic site) lyase n=1 Tax=Micrococcoides hystricis TaxID=1572761 RepID=A0ABV6P9N1_9MICC
MPEGHSLFRLARRFREGFAGQRVAVSSPQGKFAHGATLVDGRMLRGAFNHGKHLFLDFDDRFVHIHLGLYGKAYFGGSQEFIDRVRIGKLHAYQDLIREDYQRPDPPVGAVRIRVIGDHGWADVRGPNRCEVINPDQLQQVLARLGPDPLQRKDGDVELFARNLQRATPVGLLLMDQSVVAGIGNIYRAEVLFLNQVDPATLGKQVRDEHVEGIWDSTVEQLGYGAEEGRIVTIRDPKLRHRIHSDHYVYQRQNRQCVRCGTNISVREAQGRKLFWCPGCQRQ